MHSRNIIKLRKSVSRINAKQAAIRNNMAHQLTTKLAKTSDTVVIENLKVANMTASAKGDIESPGKNVKQKSGLNRALLNIAPYNFRTQLEYKVDKFGGSLKVVSPQYTSQTCSNCGYVDKENRKGASFRCKKCGFEENADINAAVNIRNKALHDE